MQPGKTYRCACFAWTKDADQVLPRQKEPLQVLPRQQMPKATFSQPYITIHVYEKDSLIPNLCIR